jgi:hypothetical protein
MEIATRELGMVIELCQAIGGPGVRSNLQAPKILPKRVHPGIRRPADV